MVAEGKEAPKRGDFVGWTGRIADHIAGGSSASRVRSYLKGIANTTWELANWLTHAQNATRFDGEMTVDATGHLLGVFSLALVRFERGQPDRCPQCDSYRLTSDYRPELGGDGAYVTLCEACGWEDAPRSLQHSRRRH